MQSAAALYRFFREMCEALDGPKGGYFRALQNVRAGISDSGNGCKDSGAVATNPVKRSSDDPLRNKPKTQTYMIYKTILASLAVLVIAAASSFAQDSHKSGPFQGAKANTGYVTHTTEGGNSVLTLSDDFKSPDTPDPHWQVVDSKGNTYLLQKLSIKGDKMNRKITVPKYVPDIAKVQIWCAFAETNLGEAAFEHPVK